MTVNNSHQATSGPTSELGHYGRWIQAWIQHRSPTDQLNGPSLIDLDRQMVTLVAQRVEAFENGTSNHLEFPAGATVEQMAIAAELAPMLDTLEDLAATDNRDTTSAETDLLASRTWGDRPSLTQLRELGQDLAEPGTSPWEDLGFTPTAYLPSELRVIAQAAAMTTQDLYQL